jgi:hypothetical protein
MVLVHIYKINKFPRVLVHFYQINKFPIVPVHTYQINKVPRVPVHIYQINKFPRVLVHIYKINKFPRVLVHIYQINKFPTVPVHIYQITWRRNPQHSNHDAVSDSGCRKNGRIIKCKWRYMQASGRGLLRHYRVYPRKTKKILRLQCSVWRPTTTPMHRSYAVSTATTFGALLFLAVLSMGWTHRYDQKLKDVHGFILIFEPGHTRWSYIWHSLNLTVTVAFIRN